MSKSLGKVTDWAGEPSFPALITAAGIVTYADLEALIAGMTRRLRDSGLRPGQGILLDPSDDAPGWIVALMACLAADARVVVTDESWSAPVRQRALRRLPSPAAAGFAEDGSRITFVDPSRGETPEGERGAGIWLFTSGTTADPEPHFRSVADLGHMVARVKDRWPRTLTENRPVVLCTAPLSHGFGLINGLLLTLELGGTLVVADGGDPEGVMGLVRETGARVLLGWPSHYEALARRELWSDSSNTKLAWCVSSSFKLDPAVAHRFAEISGCPVRSQYGMTETGPLCLDGETPAMSAPDCVGRPLRGVEVRVLGPEGGEMAAHTTGRLCVRVEGTNFVGLAGDAHAYWDTGDFGHVDDSGRIFVAGRARGFTDERKEIRA
ncbi:MAG: class I adenylate-forming enzyme family protein [Alphaproteobacteria bacterium]